MYETPAMPEAGKVGDWHREPAVEDAGDTGAGTARSQDRGMGMRGTDRAIKVCKGDECEGDDCEGDECEGNVGAGDGERR